ncbi:MAG: 6-phosphofructokinase [Planctomycetes bacterium]|nr:6-phosphofructokinase [Planctomycetota bacterium]
MLRCLIATLGKDAPGVNAVVRSATRLALRRGFEVTGVRRGFPGILEGSFRPLKEPDVGFILGKGGSLLGSVDFRVPPEGHETIVAIAARLRKFDLVVATGGLGSFAILSRAYALNDMGITTTMFVPASVENEFLCPDHLGEGEVDAESVGADTAANTAIEAIDRLREQSYFSRTVFLVQTIGTKGNYLPVQIGLACGAHRIYLPLYPALSVEAKAEIRRLYGPDFDPNRIHMKELVGWIERMFEEGRRRYLVVIIPNGIPLGHVVPLGGSGAAEGGEERKYDHIVSSVVPMELTALKVVDELVVRFAETGSVQVRYVVLDDLQHGGAPTVRDRLLGSIYGEAAIEEFLSLVRTQDFEKRGNLNLLAVKETSRVAWKCHPRSAVLPLFTGPSPRAGGLDPLPFFRQSCGTVSGYKPLAVV